MSATLLILACSLTAADFTVVVTPTPSNVVITITMPAAGTNVVVQPVVASVPAAAAPPDARASLPRAVPMPPIPPDPKHLIKDWHGDPKKFTWKDAPWLRPLPAATNHPSYPHHHRQWLADRAAKGLRRSE